MVQQRSRTGSAFLWGIIFGLILAVLIVLDRAVLAGIARRGVRTGFGSAVGAVLFSSGIAVLVTIILYFLAGVLAARRARALEAGLFAGMIAGAIAGATRLTLTVLTLAALRPPPVTTPSRLRLERLVTAGTLASAVAALVVDVLVGTGLGALGGLIGRGSAPAALPSAAPYQPYQPGELTASGSAASPPRQGPYPMGQDLPSARTPGGDYPTTPSSFPPQP
jgi:hypothetical protein